MRSRFSINVSDLDKALIHKIAGAIGRYTAPLIYKDRFIGSATFVSVDNLFGLLTAYHVADVIDFSSGSLGLVITERPHRLEIEVLHLIHLPLAKPQEEEFGPDLSFIRIPDSPKLSEIRAKKSFYPLRDQLSSALETDGLWMVAGHPGKLQRGEPSIGDFSEVIELPGIGACSGIDRSFDKYGFHVIEIGVDYSDRSEALPTFRGVSGGGVWRVPLYRKEEDETETIFFDDFYLCGVAFWESGDIDGKGVLRCHGAHAIYEFVPTQITQAGLR